MKFSVLLVLGAAAVAAAAPGRKTDEDGNTTFNGLKVPPMLELTPDNFDKEIHASKYILIKHYSPYCPHCIDYAPAYQSLYEYYHTSKPATTTDLSFTELYDFRFATLNCVAYFDLCSTLKVTRYPSTVLYKEAAIVETVNGVKDLDALTAAIEPFLEEERPGSRPKELALPEIGGNQTPDFNAAAHITSENAPAKEAAPKEEKKPEEPVKDKTDKVTADKAVIPEKVIPAKTEPKEPPKPTETFNPDGASVPLNPETFESLVASTQKPWFIKFYAPWCHHCQAMAPNWQQLGKEMKGKLNIGEVNCEAEKKLCKDVGVYSYPTLLFFRGAQRVEYEGLRGIGDFVQFAKNIVETSAGIQDVDAASLKALEEKEEVIFIYFYDQATTSEDFQALERLPYSLVGHGKVVKTKDAELIERYKIWTFPRLLVSREGRPTYYNPLTPPEMRNVPALLTWMKSVWLPIVPELIASNSREIMDGKIVVLGILNREEQDVFASAKSELKAAANEWMDKQILAFQQERQGLRDAKQLKIDSAEERDDESALRQAKAIRIDMNLSNKKEVAFAWVDGVFWQRWLKSTYGIEANEKARVIINDEDRYRYWDTTAIGGKILPSKTSILDTLSKVAVPSPQIKPKYTLSTISKFFFDIRMAFVDHPFFSIAFLLCAIFVSANWFRNRIRRSRGGHFARMDDSWSTKELMKEGLLGGGMNGNGKTD